jgi:hypothetical protein
MVESLKMVFFFKPFPFLRVLPRYLEESSSRSKEELLIFGD